MSDLSLPTRCPECQGPLMGCPEEFLYFSHTATCSRRRLAVVEDEDGAPVSQAVNDVIAERTRQINVEGWTAKHDDEHQLGTLAQAAACYCVHSGPWSNAGHADPLWPFDFEWFKPTSRRRDLVKAAALIIAEIESIDRQS